ncbi:S-adenosyl-L-methionine-dependent methyltransferase [Aspergillus heteromorphus CBS 117.55]|uniref:S-adenosyl-L-methionine-dependent methyltransferase n=1 Tax=Aspergillus heteromorphus CBS 117.55 TaxID=1448321 RepID=A0A317WJW3_9EURO|nr:S-adenosyl-L-methionine-dependent methyltransferase [Aspergillus heteromorphus CBS 117.55]PWY86736.1 S-adenosyl-L-methionine-dependent methyltransferase [Aspergillus heteromorphus CBS 117.55]
MAQTTPPTAFKAEQTFLAYNQAQAQAYAHGRPDYHANLYAAVLEHHTSTGGQLDTIIDLGCGPGNVARALAPHFRHAIGLDPSPGMVEAARAQGGVTGTSEGIRYEVCSAEDLGASLSPAVGAHSVDLITAANAAHWFDMDQFWASAARVLKPGGSVIVWTTGELRFHPSMPNAAKIQTTLDEMQDTELKPYFVPGNVLVRSRYEGLVLPWQLEKPVEEFPERGFVRREWDVGESFHDELPQVGMDRYESIVSTISPVTRWREAHPETVGTEEDYVRRCRRAIERLLQEAGVKKGEEKIKGAMQGVVLVVKRV